MVIVGIASRYRANREDGTNDLITQPSVNVAAIERFSQSCERMIICSEHTGYICRTSCAKQTLWLALISTPAAIISRKNSVLIASFEASLVILESQDRPRGRTREPDDLRKPRSAMSARTCVIRSRRSTKGGQ